MNGAESLARSLLASGVDTCFANPGTSEMHFVAALDKVTGMRCVLGLAETVVTGCADGYARMTGRPAATLLDCGPGLANGTANVHNARRASAPMVNIVGDHATWHRPHDSPLTYDTEGLARTVSHWVRSSGSSERIGADGAAAVQAAMTPPGRIATLILPADTAWSDGGRVADPLPVPERSSVAPDTIRNVALALRRRERAVLVVSGQALGEEGLEAAQRVAHASGVMLKTPTQIPRMARGRGRVPVDRIPYAVDLAMRELDGVRHVVLVGARPPHRILRIPGETQSACPVRRRDPCAREAGGRRRCGLARSRRRARCAREGRDSGGRDRARVAQGPVRADRLRDHPGRAAPRELHRFRGCGHVGSGAPGTNLQCRAARLEPDHRGAIGQGFPAATGAALACPDRKVVCLQADGAGMYTLQALWTQARRARRRQRRLRQSDLQDPPPRRAG